MNQTWLDDWLEAGKPEFEWSIDRTINGDRSTAVPEPGSFALLAAGLVTLLVVYRPRRGIT